MKIEMYTPEDLEAIKAIHKRSGFDYTLPNELTGPKYISGRVAKDGSGLGMACFLRKSAEVYLICNSQWRTPQFRLEAIRQLQHAVVQDARKSSIPDMVAFLPPQVSERFGSRLLELGWQQNRPEWQSYSLEVGE